MARKTNTLKVLQPFLFMSYALALPAGVQGYELPLADEFSLPCETSQDHAVCAFRTFVACRQTENPKPCAVIGVDLNVEKWETRDDDGTQYGDRIHRPWRLRVDQIADVPNGYDLVDYRKAPQTRVQHISHKVSPGTVYEVTGLFDNDFDKVYRETAFFQYGSDGSWILRAFTILANGEPDPEICEVNSKRGTWCTYYAPVPPYENM